jgi:alpha-glucosidase
MKMKKMSILAALALSSGAAFALESPNKQLDVSVTVNPDQTLSYTVKRNGQAVLLPSPLGLTLAGEDFSRGLKLVATSQVKPVSEQYTMAVGKRAAIRYQANEQVFSLANAAGRKMDVAFRVSDDGLAFRYVVADPKIGAKRFVSEATGFAFSPKARAFLQPMAVAKSGWGKTNPSYEEHYQVDIPVGQPSPLKAGWVFPALFRSGDTWVALTEANMDGSFHAEHGRQLPRLAPGHRFARWRVPDRRADSAGSVHQRRPAGGNRRRPGYAVARGGRRDAQHRDGFHPRHRPGGACRPV